MKHTSEIMRVPEQAGTGAPLGVALEGTLLATDPVTEAALLLLRRNLLYMFLLPIWMMAGRDRFVREITQRVNLDPARLAYRDATIAGIEAARAAGRPITLISRTSGPYAEAIAAHLKLFDDVRVLAGDSATTELEMLAPGASTDPSGSGIAQYVRMLRLHQWVKNTLVFVPLVLDRQVLVPAALGDAVLAFIAFGLCASSAYVLNDLVDLQDDRRHPTKRFRPIAASQVPIWHAALMVPLLALFGFAVSALLPAEFRWVLAAYFAGTVAYSFFFKRTLLADVIVLATLYTLRIVAGSAAIGIPRSVWLLAFSVFIFLSLALVKRYVELKEAFQAAPFSERARGYIPADREMLGQFGTASGLIAVLVLVLFIDSDSSRDQYPQRELIWMLCPMILYVITRIWILARRDQLPADPVLFALKDWRTLLAMGLAGAFTLLASL